MEFELQREMYEHQHQPQQHFVDSEDNGGSCFEDRKSTNLNLERPSSSLSNRSGSSSNNVDTVLLKDLAEMVPLVESLMDRRPKSSFTRRSSVIYTKTPSKETYPKKQVTESKVRKKVVQPQPVPARKPRECCAHNHQHKSSCTNELTFKSRSSADELTTFKSRSSADELTTFKSRSSADELTTSKTRSSGTEKDRKDVVILQERMANLQNELLEKDELLKSAETSMNEMAALQAKLEELKTQAAEKDSLIKTAHLQISDAKMKLADKQTTVEKLQWEAMTSKEKVEKLQEDLDSMSVDVSAFMLLFEGLEKSNSTSNDEVYETTPYELDQLPPIYDIDEIQMRQMEEVRKAYIAAVTTAKENQDEESVILAAKARLLLQSFVLGPKNVTNPMMQENNCVIVS